MPFRHNHYVPISYQRRFMPPGQGKYYRLDLKPETGLSGGIKYTRWDFTIGGQIASSRKTTSTQQGGAR